METRLKGTYLEPVLCIPISKASNAVTIFQCIRNIGLVFGRTVGAKPVFCRVDLHAADNFTRPYSAPA